MSTATMAAALEARPVPAAWSQFVTLVVRTLSERWRSLVGWGVGLIAIAGLQLAVYPSVASSAASMQEFVNQWPEAFREAFGLDAYATGYGFLNAELFSLMIPVVLIAVALGGAAAATAGEEERGTADLLLSMPVSRLRLMIAKVASIVVSVFVLGAATVVVLLVGAPLVELDVSGAGVVAGVFMVGLLALMFGGFGLLVSALTGKRAPAIGAGIGLALAAFLLNVLAPMADWLESWQQASPFYWALDSNPLLNGVDWPMAALMAALAVIFMVLAIVVFRRRDLSSR